MPKRAKCSRVRHVLEEGGMPERAVCIGGGRDARFVLEEVNNSGKHALHIPSSNNRKTV